MFCLPPTWLFYVINHNNKIRINIQYQSTRDVQVKIVDLSKYLIGKNGEDGSKQPGSEGGLAKIKYLYHPLCFIIHPKIHLITWMQSSGFQAAWCPSSWSCGWGTSSRAPARPPGTFFPSSELWVLHLSPQSSLPPPQVAPAEHRGEWWWVASCWCGGKWRWGDKSFWAKTWFTEVSLSQPHRMSSQNFFITLSQFLFPWFVFWFSWVV